jgi:hypothetical protein
MGSGRGGRAGAPPLRRIRGQGRVGEPRRGRGCTGARRDAERGRDAEWRRPGRGRAEGRGRDTGRGGGAPGPPRPGHAKVDRPEAGTGPRPSEGSRTGAGVKRRAGGEPRGRANASRGTEAAPDGAMAGEWEEGGRREGPRCRGRERDMHGVEEREEGLGRGGADGRVPPGGGGDGGCAHARRTRGGGGWAAWGTRQGGEGRRLGHGWKPAQKGGRERNSPFLFFS